MFVCFLLCLEAIGLLNKSDHGVIVTRVFSKYVSIVRMLQTKYWCVWNSLISFVGIIFRMCNRLEPAGSRGAWGLDDYCFLPFYWYCCATRNCLKVVFLFTKSRVCLYLLFHRGSSQLVHHDAITPASIHDDRVVQENANEFLYLDSLLFIKTVRELVFMAFFI